MLNKIKGQPLWYKVWAISVLLGAVYFLFKLFFGEPSSYDRFIHAYTLISLVLDYLIFPVNKT
jgi:hypothetical protein